MLPLYRRLKDIPVDEAPEELIRGILSTTGLALLYGATGVGKTHLAFQAACAWQSGASAFGMTPTRPLAVVYIQADMGRGHIARLKQQAPEAGIIVPDMGIIEFPPGAPKDIFDPRVHDAIKAAAQDNPDLWVVDVIDRMHSENPNDGQAVNKILERWQTVTAGHAILYLKHPRKRDKRVSPADTDLEEAAGHLNWANSCDAVLRLTSKSLRFEKLRLGPPLVARPIKADLPFGFLRLREEILEDRVQQATVAHPEWSVRTLADALKEPKSTIQDTLQRLKAPVRTGPK